MPRFINEPVIQNRTEIKVEDDRSFAEKAKDAIKDAAHTVKEALTPEVKDKDIAKAAIKERDLREKEEMDRRKAWTAQAQQEQMQAHAEQLQDEQLTHQERALHHSEKADKQAEKMAKLQNKQAEQQEDKCRDAMRKRLAGHGDVKVTHVTDIH